ncbi:hypothetical protein GW17_00044438, partial [Ensete ventricosum]
VRLTMPYERRWAKSNFEKFANGRNYSICRSSVDKSNQKCFLRPTSPLLFMVGLQAANADSARLNSSCMSSETDGCSSTERVDCSCSSQAGSSNDFHPVIYERRGRSGTTKHSKDIQEVLSSVGIEDYRCTKPNIESHREANSVSSSGSPIQKWVPVGRKDLIASDMGYLDCLKVPVMDETVLHHSYPKTAEVEDVNKDGDILNSEANKLTDKLSTYPNSTEVLDIHTVINYQTHKIEDKEFIGFETDLDKIVGAVKDAYESQTAVESVQLVTGSPVADFEKFLFSATPVIGRTQDSRSCNSCSHERLKDSSLCWHENPNISLKSIWQWYEELGCFGLEVKAHDFYNSRRLRNGCHEFTAYFVPYLSAVQLFGISSGTKYCNLSGQSARAYEGNETAKSVYCVAWYPIYRIPDGSFHAAFLTYHSLGHFVHRSSPESGHGLSEYVVSPVVGLQTYNHKVHLLQVFSIYEISDVPLQGESWFQPRDMNSKVIQSEDVNHSDTSELIKERLRTLRQTASVMARAVVSKGNQRYVNWHPDYNFFVSRSG